MIDASGRGGVLSRKFNLRVDEPRLANVALFSHYSGVPRQSGRRAGDIRIVARPDLGWFWLIPISDELTSVGVVLPGTEVRSRAADTTQLLDQLIADTPVVADLLRNARREWPMRVEKDFSFSARAYAGDRWLVAGDAGSFLDPVFSTGVAIALESGLEAAQAVSQGLAAGDLTVARFTRFARRQRQRYVSFRRFVLAFYTPEFRDLFFSEDPPRGMFRALVTVFAGYWQPPALTRLRVWLFFVLVRAQRRFGFAPRFTALQDRPQLLKAATCPANVATLHRASANATIELPDGAPFLPPPQTMTTYSRPLSCSTCHLLRMNRESGAGKATVLGFARVID